MQVLLVNDDAAESALLARWLRAEGHQVDAVSSGEGALGAITRQKPDLLVGSALLPGLTGLELCRLLRADEHYRDIPFLLLADGDAPEQTLQAVECGADACLTRPVEPAILIARAVAVTDPAGPPSSVRPPSSARTAQALTSALVDAFAVNDRLRSECSALAKANGHLEKYTRRLENEIELTDDRYRTLLDAASDGIFVTDARGVVLEANERGQCILGVSRGRLLGRPLFEGTATAQMDSGAFEAALAARHPFTAEVELCIGGEASGFLEVSASPMPRGDQQLFLLIARDVTERRKTVDELRAKEAALRAAVEERARMESELVHAQKLEAVGQLAAGIAHEINTPLQYIGDNLAFLSDAAEHLRPVLDIYAALGEAVRVRADGPGLMQGVDRAISGARLPYLREQVPRAIEQSLDGIQQVTSIVHALKEFSHPGHAEKTTTDLNRAIRSTVTVARNEWKYVADVELLLDDSLPPVPCLPNEINQALLNIVINAAHAIAERYGDGCEPKGQITISSQAAKDHVRIAVTDTGSGIPAAIRDKIFNPFFTTKPVGKGTGQGLAIARSVVVEKHGGRLFFESKEGVGTTFVICLPLAVPDASNQRRTA